MEFEEAINRFQDEMWQKFQLRRARHPNDDIITEGVEKAYTQEQAFKRLQDEWNELQLEPGDPREAVDVANMCFIVWWRSQQ